MKRLLVFVLCCAICAGIPSCGKKKKDEPTREAASAPGGIVDVVAGDGRFSTLSAAIDAAGLAETLAGEGPFTLFAPVDSAFAKLPPGAAESLLQEAPTLKNILLLHVVPGRFTAAEAAGVKSLMTALGDLVPVALTPGGKVTFGTAAVVIADIPARNGVIHAIDRVLLPPPTEP